MRTPATAAEWLPKKGRRSRKRAESGQPPDVDGTNPGTARHSNVPAQQRVAFWRQVQAGVDQQNARWEATINRAITMLLGGVVILVVILWATAGTDLGLPLLLLCVAYGAYNGISWLTLVNGSGAALPVLQWVNATVEASLGTAVLAIMALVKGPEWAATSAGLLLYPLAILVSTARMQPRLCLYVGALVSLEYLGLHYVLVRPALDPVMTAQLPNLGDVGAWERAFWLAAAAVLAAVATYQVRRRALLAEAQTYERRWIEKEFGRYVSPDVVRAIMRGEAAFGLAERRDVTVLFCDLRDFTGVCVREAPEDVVALLNTFYERVCTIVESHGGTVNKFLGDGVLALFGAPDEHPNHAHAAVEASHEILAAADELKAQGGIWDAFEIGIGVDTGDVVVGPIGSPTRVEYTAIGATVNRAARLQSLARAAQHRIIVSRTTLEALGPRANVVSLGSVSLKGFSGPETVYAFRHS